MQQASGASVNKGVLDLPQSEFGRVRAPAGRWASLVRSLDPITVSSTLSLP
jgi:splicing factor 3B subunit 3